MTRLRGEFKDCTTNKTAELGKGNTEPAETILRAVAAVCRPKEMELREVYARTPYSQGDVEWAIRNDRREAEDAGVAALLEARAAK